ncbi:MAG: hypothetical protein ACT4N4_06945 [Rhodospirillales bacterium]
MNPARIAAASGRRILLFPLAALWAGTAPAQDLAVQPPVEEVAAAHRCLCLEQKVQDSRFEMDVRNGLFQKSRDDTQALEREVEQRRSAIDVNDRAQIDAFRALLDRAAAARGNYEQVAVPDQQRAVAGYNAAVGELNAACGGKSYSTHAWEAARKLPDCPRN